MGLLVKNVRMQTKMGKELILVRGQGFLEVNVNDLVGTATDVVGERYVRVGSKEEGYTWLLETKFLEDLSRPIPILEKKESNLVVDYGVKQNDPLKDKIHELEFEGNLIFQYQIDPVTGYIKRTLIAQTSDSPLAVSDKNRFRPSRVKKGKRVASL